MLRMQRVAWASQRRGKMAFCKQRGRREAVVRRQLPVKQATVLCSILTLSPSIRRYGRAWATRWTPCRRSRPERALHVARIISVFLACMH